MLPDFFIVGAAKCGTTSLHHYLSSHPDIFMPVVKEPNFFIDRRGNWEKGLEWYASLFDGSDPDALRGEASVRYTEHPTFTGSPGLIAQVVPRARFIYLVRDPVQRIRSHYIQDLSSGVETRPLEEAVRENRHYLDVSRYGMQMELYREHFDDDRFLIVESDDLKNERRATLRKVLGFLGLQESEAQTTEVELNTASRQRTTRTVIERARGNVIYRGLSALIPDRAKRFIDDRTSLIHRPVAPTAPAHLSVETVHWIYSELGPDLLSLSDLLGEERPSWWSNVERAAGKG